MSIAPVRTRSFSNLLSFPLFELDNDSESALFGSKKKRNCVISSTIWTANSIKFVVIGLETSRVSWLINNKLVGFHENVSWTFRSFTLWSMMACMDTPQVHLQRPNWCQLGNHIKCSTHSNYKIYYNHTCGCAKL